MNETTAVSTVMVHKVESKSLRRRRGAHRRVLLPRGTASICLAIAIVVALPVLSLFSFLFPSEIDFYSPASITISKEDLRTKGVFVFKVMRAQHATQALCHLTHFFNAGPKYPIRIFADHECTEEARLALEAVSGGADVRVIVDTQGWRQFPPTLTETERADVIKHCDNLTTPETAKCTQLKVGLGYVYMGYWRYMKMADEPSLSEFEYFVSIDTDAYLTKKQMPDPFKIMESNSLNGIFNIEGYQAGKISFGIQKAAEATFSVDERRNRFLDSPQYSYFDRDGLWGREGYGKKFPSIWGCFYGGRLDFFRTERFKSFARMVAPFTYRFRTDEQPVIGAAWSVLGDGDKVWYLPKRGIHMGVYHHGWIDNREAVRLPPANRTGSQTYRFHALDQWSNFTENRKSLVKLQDYIKSLEYDQNDNWWRKCLTMCNKGCQPRAQNKQ